MTFSDSQSPFPPDSENSRASETASAPAPVPQFPFPPQPQPPQQNFPEDIRTPWGGGEIWLFLGFAIGSLLAMETALALFMMAHYHLTSAQLMNRLETSAPLAVSFQAAWSAVMFLFLFVMIRVYHGAPFWSSLRWRRVRPPHSPAAVVYAACIFSGLALAIAVSDASEFAGEQKKLPIEQLFDTRSNVLWLAAFGIALAPLIEETFFRGFLYPVLARKWGIAAGVIVTGTLFGLMHAAQLWGGWPQIVLLIFVGIVLTFARARTGSVVASYLIHLSYNSFLFSGFFLNTHSLKNIPPAH
jgi:membrane protease YdiL (CAAX protease family)